MRNRKPLSSVFFQKNQPSFTNLQSFTLIELLMVIVILGLMAGLAIPNLDKTYVNFQLSEAAKNIASLMRYAQNRAVMKEREYQIDFDLNNTQYQLMEGILAKEGEEDKETTFQPMASQFGRAFHIPSEIAVELDNLRIRFYPDGKIDKVRVYLHNGRGNYVTISTQEQVGYVQIFDFKVE